MVPDTLAPALSTPVLWLVRHGESTWNALGLAQGHADQARLTPLGARQARYVASQLRGRPIGALHALYRRVADFADDLLSAGPPGEVAVVAHGGTLRVLTAYLRGVPVERMS